jgi:hypothetical protein
MDIEILEYFRRFQQGEYNLLHAGVLYGAGLGSVWLAGTLLPGRLRPDRVATFTLAALAALVGLVLTSTIYSCTSCNPPPGCDIVTVGVPFPQEVRQRDPDLDPFGPCWWSLSESSPAAAAGNFALGTLGLPILVALFGGVRSRPSDEMETGGGARPTTGPIP